MAFDLSTFDSLAFDAQGTVMDVSARSVDRGDLRLTWDVTAADLRVADNDLVTDEGLETAVILSLFTDRRADEADTLPDGHVDPRGWWGDEFPSLPGDRTGSRLWLLSREKQQARVLVRAEEYAREALAWLLSDRIAARLEVAAEFIQRGWLGLHIVIHRPQTALVEYRFNLQWAAQEARAD